MSRGWPNCLRAVAATVMLIQEARKLTLGRTITVYVPHMVITVLEQKGGHWLSQSRTMKYQVVLTEQDDVILKTTNLVNPAVFLSSIQEEGQLEHDRLATFEYVYSSRENSEGCTIGATRLGNCILMEAALWNKESDTLDMR